MLPPANRRYPVVAMIVIAAALAHITTLAGGFVWLDHAHLEGRLALAGSDGWWTLFTRGFAGTGFYRPLMALSLSVDDRLGGAPWLYHAITVAWHAGAAVMTFVAAEALGLTRARAALAAGLFAVHPITSLVAGAIAFRSEAMIAVSLLALVALHVRGRALGAALALAAGALVKETALVLGPLFVIALERWPPAVRPAPAVRRRVLLAEAAALVAAVALRLAFAPSWRAGWVALGPSEAVGTRLATFLRHAEALLGVDRSLCDASPVTPAWHWTALVGAALAAGLVVLAWRRRGPALLLALSLLPALQLVPVMRWWSPHYLYVPLAFAAMLIAEALGRFERRGLAVGGVLVAALALVAAREGRRFRNDESLWTPEVAARPSCREGQFYLGEVAMRARRWDEAAARYQAALVQWPGVISYVDRGAALQNLGVAQLEGGRFAAAAETFAAALSASTSPGERRRLTHNLATAELRRGNPAEAERLLAPEARRPDAHPASLFILARAVHQQGRTEEAAALLARLPRR